jgi:hypothetical protein
MEMRVVLQVLSPSAELDRGPEDSEFACSLFRLSSPQIRQLLADGTLQLGLFGEKDCEVEAAGIRSLLRKNECEAAKERHRLADKLTRLSGKIERLNGQVEASVRWQPEAGSRQLQAWIVRHKDSHKNKFAFWREHRRACGAPGVGRCKAPRRRRCVNSSRSGNAADARTPPRPAGRQAR